MDGALAGVVGAWFIRTRPNALAQEGRRLVDDVRKCMHDVLGKEGLSRSEQLCQVLVM